ncbi:MAG: large repetitive protein [Frankiaceae bacterium]|jgi:hypothetical protein|nr:large repetitive protein [Frankiaceae bacterium]
MRRIVACAAALAALAAVASPVTAAAPKAPEAPGRWQGSVSPRYAASAVYDSARRQVVLIGGRSQKAAGGFGDTWTWDGTRWAERVPMGNGPSGRYDAQMAYHEAARQVVLFGGFNDASFGYLGDTWTWDGKRWTSRAGTAPPNRRYASMVYDPERRQVVLFGGFGGDASTPETAASADYLGDTWTWDGARWTKRAGAGPSPRRNAHMVYDAAAGKVVLFGGYGAGTDPYLADTWTWDGVRWVQQAGAGPSGRTGAGMVYDAATRDVVLFGGYNIDKGPTGTGWAPTETYLADTWTWNAGRWTKRGAGPSGREDAQLAYDATARQVLLFGGQSQPAAPGNVRLGDGRTVLADTWTWDGRAWARRATTGPHGRVGANLVYAAGARKVLLFGGIYAYSPDEELDDSWTWSGGRWTQTASVTPPERQTTHVAYHAAARQVLLFGGYDSVPRGDTWTWNGAGWVERSGTAPSARNRAAMAYDAAARHVLLFGGTARDYSPTASFSSTVYLADTWTWDGAKWTQRSGTAPPARADAPMAYDEARRQVVLFGGYAEVRGPGGTPYGGSNQFLGDTWTWDGAKWAQRSGAGPSPRREAQMVYDPVTRRVVLFGGYTLAGAAVYHADTWTWDGARWTKVSGPSPRGRSGASMVYDPASRQVVLFGGMYFDTTERYLADTWTWDGRRWTQRSGAGPGPRAYAAMVADPGSKNVLLFGGLGDLKVTGRYLGDTWTWDGRRWVRRTGIGPSARRDGAAVYDAATGEALLVGGTGAFGNVGETWRW